MENQPSPVNILAAAPVLGSITCTPATATVGESVCVEVRAPNGIPYQNSELRPISINGIPGSKQYIVWKIAGTKRIVVIAHNRAGRSERMTASVQITPPPPGVSPAFLRVGWSPEEPTVGLFSIDRGEIRSLSPDAQAAMRAAFAPILPRVPVTHTCRSATLPAIAFGGSSPLAYDWEFSDGQSFGSMYSSIGHDFGPHLNPDRPYDVFHVKVTIHDPAFGDSYIQRSVTVWNAYHMMKHRGVLQPSVVESHLNAIFDKARGGVWRANFTVRNPEPVDITLTTRRFEWIFEEDTTRPGKRAVGRRPAAGLAPGNGPSPGDQPTIALETVSVSDAVEGVQVVLKAKSITEINVAVPNSLISKKIVAFIVHYFGTGPGTLPVYVTAAFDIPDHVSPLQLTVELEAQLKKLARSGLVPNPRSIKSSELKELMRRGSIKPSLVVGLVGEGPSFPDPLDAHEPPPMAIEGKECDPWNLPEVIPNGMFCMPTAQTRYVKMPARFMNAKKGDIVLSPGDGSLIAKTLAAVDPPQAYSHSGMMTRNRDEITHSTASEARLTDTNYVDADGFRPDILKYLWPGVITQTVKQAVEGEDFVDPESGKSYTVGGFGSLQTLDLAVAMVVKPNPLNETSEIRAQLHSIADFAWKQAGKSHYRFFCYTDPTVGLKQKAPDEAKWAAGTFPTVCSSLVWMSIRQSGAQIEGALEPPDMQAGAQLADDTPDGLYLYQADERLNAGEVLYGSVGNLALQAAGQLGAGITDIEEDLGNQILNTFASDWSDTDATESDKWRQATDANAVSPQNLMFYDPPLYGYAEPLIYRGERWEEITVYRWKTVPETGAISGLVRYQGELVGGADVQITESLATHSDANGQFNLKPVPVGSTIVSAQKVMGTGASALLMTAQATVSVNSNQTTSVILDLIPPSHVFRRILIDGGLKTIDYEWGAAAYPINVNEINGIVDLDPGDATHATKIFDCVADDDTLGRLYLTFDLQPNDSVTVKATIRCYDSNSDDTDDYDEASLDPFVLHAGGNSSKRIFVDGDNYAEAMFYLTNETNPS